MQKHELVRESISLYWERDRLRDAPDELVECSARCTCGVEFYEVGQTMADAVRNLETVFLRHLDELDVRPPLGS
jgi:hypothetical protein